MKYKRNIVLLVLLFAIFSINAQTLTIKITNIKNKNGKIIVGIFKDSDKFVKNGASILKTYSKTDVVDGNLTVKFELEPGIYGISLLDDVDNDGEMKYNFLGIPREGYGFSDFDHQGMRRPVFKDFDFILGNNDMTINIKIRYL